MAVGAEGAGATVQVEAADAQSAAMAQAGIASDAEPSAVDAELPGSASVESTEVSNAELSETVDAESAGGTNVEQTEVSGAEISGDPCEELIEGANRASAGETGTEPTEAPDAQSPENADAGPAVDAGAEPSEGTDAEQAVDAGAEPSEGTDAEQTEEAGMEATDGAEAAFQPEEGACIPRSAAEDAEFSRGYARLCEGAPGYAGPHPEDEMVCQLEAGVVYAVDRRMDDGGDRLECAFDGGAEEVHVWVDALCLHPLGAEEATEFAEACASKESVLFLQGAEGIPLGCVKSISAAVCALAAVEAEPVSEVEAPALLVERTEIALGLKESAVLNVAFSDGEAHGLSFSSRNTRIAKVDASGKITGKKRGSTAIQIRSEFGEEVSVNLRVLKAPSKVSVKAARMELGVGETLQMDVALSSDSASALSFFSSDESVAYVDASGAIHALTPGTAEVGVGTFNGKRASGTLRVCAAPETVALQASSVELGVGEKYVFRAALPEGSAAGCKFSSDDPAILEIDAATGAATARDGGDCRARRDLQWEVGQLRRPCQGCAGQRLAGAVQPYAGRGRVRAPAGGAAGRARGGLSCQL